MGECLITRRGGEAYELPVLNSAYPANVTVVEAANASASFNVQIATPGKPAEYTYQWYLNGAKISGATNSSYTKTGLTTAGTHTLYCVVTNKAGTVTSRVATLTVRAAIPTFTYTGNYQTINDGNYNWRIKFLTSGTLRFTDLGNMPNGIQVFCVGGGGASGTSMSGGGGGGYTKTGTFTTAINTNYMITIGAGGSSASGGGGVTSALGVNAYGGYGGVNPTGGSGGSGGGLRVNLAKAAVRCTVAVAAVEQINTIVQRSFVAALVVPAEAEKVRVTVKLVLMALQTLVAVQVAQGKIVEVLP